MEKKGEKEHYFHLDKRPIMMMVEKKKGKKRKMEGFGGIHKKSRDWPVRGD